MSHTDWCKKSDPLAITDARCNCFEPDTDWAADRPCGGISTNGSKPPLCEVHMKPWGHRSRDGDPTSTHHACPTNWCGPWKDGACVDCGKPRRLGDPPSVPLSAWCDGTPHSPDAIPPLPFHDWRFDMDNPWSICARCEAAQDMTAKIGEAESAALIEHLNGTCHLSEWSCSHCEAADA